MMIQSGDFLRVRMNFDPAPPPPSAFEQPPRRRRSGCLYFVRWYLTGLALWTALGSALILLAVFVFPSEPTNILILGLDRRPGESLVSRSDTMILTRVDPAQRAVTMLSLPRDLWVTLPDGGPNRINTAHRFAELNAPGTGPAAALQTVAINFGVPVERYVRLDFDGFVRIIDAVGGITIDVESTFVDYQYPTYDGGTTVVTFEAGEQQLDGERALQYARIRHGSSDFARAARQQQIIAAFVRRLSQPSAWPRLPALAAALNTAVDSNISLFTAARLAPTILMVGADGIERFVVEGVMVEPFRTAGGAAVQRPVWENIDPLLRAYFGKA